MAVVQGIKEKASLYPFTILVSVEPEKQLRDVENSSILKFFVNVQGKTKLETNLQSASLLPHYNTFEARAMRVVISDLPPELPGRAQGQECRLTTVTDHGYRRASVALSSLQQQKLADMTSRRTPANITAPTMTAAIAHGLAEFEVRESDG